LCRPRRAACRAACSACSVMDEKGNSATSMGLRFGDLALASHGVTCGPLSTLRIQSIGFQKKCVNLTGATPQQLPAAARRPPAPRAATGPSRRALLPLRPPALHAVPQRSCSTPVPRAAAAPDLCVVAGFPVPYTAAAVLSRLSGEAGSQSSKEKMEPAPRLISAARHRSRGPCRHGGDGLA